MKFEKKSENHGNLIVKIPPLPAKRRKIGASAAASFRLGNSSECPFPGCLILVFSFPPHISPAVRIYIGVMKASADRGAFLS